MSDIGNRIKKLRKEKNLTQKELGDKLNVHANTISMYEKGNRKVSLETANKLSEIFNVSVDYIIKGKDKENKPSYTSLDESLLNEEKYLNLTLKNLLKDSSMVAFQDYKSWSVEDKKELLLILLDKK